MSKSIKKVAGAVLPHLGAVGGAANGLIQGDGLKGALQGGLKSGLSAAGSIVGGNIGGSLFPGTIGSALGSSASNALGSTIANQGIGKIAGSFAGNALGNSVADSLIPLEEPETPKNSGPQPFSPTRQAQLDVPGSLSGLEPDQASSNLATQGVYGGGLGPEEQSYFTNQINRRLVDDAGNLDSDLSEINPIEQAYLAQLGLGGYKDSRSLLEAMSKWKAM